MKRLLLLTLFISSISQAFEMDAKVMIRAGKRKAKAIIVTKKLKNLTSNNSFEGKDFKVVLGKSNEAISFLGDIESSPIELELLRLKAATVYYHLTEAKKFWVETVKSKKVIEMPQLTVRLEMKNKFEELRHFEDDGVEDSFNNAVSIQAGETPDYINELLVSLGREPVAPWGSEIWFRPMLKKATKNLDNSHLGDSPFTAAFKSLDGPIVEYSKRRLRNETIKALFYERYYGPYWKTLAWSVGSWATLKVLIQASKWLDPLFMEKWYYLDTALMPEAIYHEFAHVALSDKLELSHSTGSVEGIADYFAAKVSNRTRLYSKVKGHSTSNEKNVKGKKNYYRPYLEHRNYAHSDFVVALLWDIEQEMPSISTRLIYNSRNYFSTSASSIYKDLLNALLKSCNDVCRNPIKGKKMLYDIFDARGL